MTIPDELLDGEAALVSSATGRPLTKRGEATRRRLLEGAELVFAEQGYHEASIVKITERAGIGLGTFYLYFDSKQSIFEALVIDLNRRVRHSMSEAMTGAATRLDAERAGFAGFFRFTAAHPALYRALDPETTAWALMGMGELIGMRFLLCERDADGHPPAELDPVVFAGMTRI